jgi:lysophospholipid acyltransferase (LPLAT)-like uncharacterized protein
MSLKERLYLWLVPALASLALKLVGKTLQVEEAVPAELHPRTRPGGPIIYAAWHSRLLLGMYVYRDCGINVLVSQSKDGELLVRALERFGFTATRGSSSRGAISSLKALASVAEAGKDIMIAPDGPRGPREQAKIGVIQLASLTGAPIVPWSWVGNRMKVVNSWDRLRIPLPFSRCVIRSGRAIEVPHDLTHEELEQKRAELEAELHRLAEQECRLCPVAPEMPPSPCATTS